MFYLCEAALPYLKKQPGSSIVGVVGMFVGALLYVALYEQLTPIVNGLGD